MPFNASKAKIKATKYYGGNVILTKKYVRRMYGNNEKGKFNSHPPI